MAFNAEKYMEVDEQSSVGTPSSNKLRVYAKTDGNLYYKDDGGTEYQIQGGSVINSIQSGTTTTEGLNQNISISSVDTSKSFVIVQAAANRTNDNYMGMECCCGRLTSSTNLRYTLRTPTYTTLDYMVWQVIEYK
jgi:hypothetical protein